MNWYEINNIEEIDSPSIVLYEDRLMFNLHTMLEMVDNNPSKLRPHIKTNKMPKVIERMLALGMHHLKASTIAEAEMAAKVGASSVLIAHQLVGPKIERLATLIERFPNTQFSTLIDNTHSLEALNKEASKRNIEVDFFIDINNGMNRSGIELGDDLNQLIKQIPAYSSLHFKGLHVYDGHLRDSDFTLRKSKIEADLKEVNALFERLKQNKPNLQLICGGTPTFSSHLSEENRICSPGTCVLWDWGYGKILTEQTFKFATLLICRVISKPTAGIITTDLGHKSVAAENPIDRRVYFLNLDNYKLLSQSEEHGVIQVENWDNIQVGDVLYGVPHHICPTINLYDEVSVIEDHQKVDSWKITARRRRLSI